MPLANGTIFAGFTILRLLGSGATSEVYLVEHRQLPHRAALKIQRAELWADPEFRERFQREYDLASTLHHPHIVEVHDRGEFSGHPWLLMDYVDGPDAGRLLREHYPTGMPPSGLFLIVTAVAEALDYAHRHGVLHQHLTPANILLADPFSDSYQILLADFGIGRPISGGTTTDGAAGTVSYPAPEQLTGGAVGGRADQYALAAFTFHLLTGAPPFLDRGPAALFGRRNSSPPESDDPGSDLAVLDPVFTKALAADPADRFNTCLDFANALTHSAAAPAPTSTKPAPPSAARASAAVADPSAGKRSAPAFIRPPAGPTTRSDEPMPAAEPTPPSDSGKKRRLRPTAVAIALLAVVLVALVSFAGFEFTKSGRSSTPPTPAASKAAASAPPAVAAPPPCGDLTAALAAMPLRDKLAQLLMVGVTGTADARAVVVNQHVGGINITSWTDLSMLTDGSLHDIAASAGPVALAVSVDEEGGRVQRLAKLIDSQPSPRVLAQTRTPQQVHDIALGRGLKMKAYGITVDFAPVVDVTDEADDEVIGDRSFGSDPATVITFAGAYAQGLRDAGLLPVLKHFPGHGHGSGDSHLGAVSTPSLADLKADDLVPYGALTTQGPVAVMVGHLQVPDLTEDDPTSLSPAAYQLLRTGGYGGPPFTGPVFTDDLSSMGAINQRYSVPEAVLRALQAGADTALWITTDQVPAVLDRLQQAVTTGELPQARVDNALQTMAKAKGANPPCGQ
jgi:beta-glucosidase-like glycosyl hydrolase/serine/threonine protein kinase